jgi:peptidoglycan L-alanyl-D-glutamate endopeptidase CwlK
MPIFSQNSLDRLRTCDDRLQEILYEAIKYVDFCVLEGHRTQGAQDEAFRKGASKLKWPNGKHNSFPSKAVDIAPYYPEVKLRWHDVVAFGRLMGFIDCIAKQRGVKLRFGLDWDGDWKTVASKDENEYFLDAPHVEIIDE